MPARIAVLVSGGGTNLQALLDAQQRGELPSGQVVAVISDRADAMALQRAEQAGVAGAVVPSRPREDFPQRLETALAETEADVVVLAGYLSIVPENVVARYAGRMLNIHPSLLPAFGGSGYWGLKVHEAALARGVKVTGATVHFVNDEPDAGEIIAQEPVLVLPGDTPEVLQRRVMEQAEWRILPRSVEHVCAQVVSARGAGKQDSGQAGKGKEEKA